MVKMSRSGVNLAVTTDGGAYNKLSRPTEYIASLAKSPPKESTWTIAESTKRKLEDVDISDSEPTRQPESKRPREGQIRESAGPSKPLVADPRRISRPIGECGMQSMFPGLDDDDSADESTQDALAYLRSVRSEASTIPRFIAAEPEIPEDEEDRTMYNDGRGDYRAWYNDGTWVAVDYEDDTGPSGERWSEGDLDPQEGYYKSLLKRYNNLRETLANADPKGLAALVESDPAKYANLKLPSRRKPWLCTLQDEYPTPALVAQMWDSNLFNALEFCTELLDYHDTISKQQSCWIWTLLALAGDRGTLDYYRIGRLRDLGQKAGQFGVRLRSGHRSAQRQSSVDDEVEQWDVDGNGTQGEESEYEPEDVAEEPKADSDIITAEHKEVEPSTAEVAVNPVHTGDPGDDASADVPANDPDEREPEISPLVAEEAAAAEMSMSSDEGEIQEEETPETTTPKHSTEAADLETARARLLAQLGDRLVKPSVPAAAPGYRVGFQKHATNRQNGGGGGRHRHDGKVCHNPNCRVNKPRSQVQGKNTKCEKSGPSSASTPPAKPLPSRAEAEKQRQLLREEELRKQRAAGLHSKGETTTATKPGSTPTQHSPTAKTPDVPDPKGAPQRSSRRSSPPAGEANARIEQNDNSGSDSELDYAAPVDLNTRVTIDMILTVVAECYGQKDLLRYREVW